MEQTQRIRGMLPFAALGMALVFSLQGCSFGGLSAGGPSPPPQPAAAAPPPASSRSVDEMDREVAGLEQQIKGLESYASEQRKVEMIYRVKHEQARGWLKGDGHPTDEDIADQARDQTVGTEMEIERLKRRVSRIQNEKQSALSQSSGCFPPEALVKMEDGSLKPFAQVRPGDRVLTYDIGDAQPVSKPVTEVYTVEGNHLYTINGELMTTAGERLLSQDGWKAVGDLRTGDRVHVGGRMVEIVSIDYRRVNATLHNMQVDDTHNFYVVTAEGSTYLVHNSSGGGGGGK
jgi:hypothetical protein